MATKAAPKKKKPAKKKKPKKTPVRAIIRRAAINTDMPEPEEASRPVLRYLAGLHYSTDLNGTTLREMHGHPMFKGVGFSTLEKWSATDGWSERRREVLERWRVQIEARAMCVATAWKC